MQKAEGRSKQVRREWRMANGDSKEEGRMQKAEGRSEGGGERMANGE